MINRWPSKLGLFQKRIRSSTISSSTVEANVSHVVRPTKARRRKSLLTGSRETVAASLKPDGAFFGFCLAFVILAGGVETTIVFNRFDLPSDMWAWDHNLLTRGVGALLSFFTWTTVTLGPAATLARSTKLSARFASDVFYSAWWPTLFLIPFAIFSQSWAPTLFLGSYVAMLVAYRLLRALFDAFWLHKSFVGALRRQQRVRLVKSAGVLDKLSREPGGQTTLSFGGVYLAFAYAAYLGLLAGISFGETERGWLIAKDAPNEILIAKVGDYWLCKQVWQVNSSQYTVASTVTLRKVDDPKVATLSKTPSVKLSALKAQETPFETEKIERKFRRPQLWPP